jgi:hypothetical protein
MARILISEDALEDLNEGFLFTRHKIMVWAITSLLVSEPTLKVYD